MLSYIVGFIALALFAANPISQLLFPGQIGRRSGAASPRPALNESLLAIESPNATAPECGPDAYSIRILNRAPLVLYLEGFVSDEERRHLLEISDPLFEPSTTTSDGGQSTQRDTQVRDSHVAVVPRTNAVRCIEARARALQGWRDDVWIERLRTQRYGPGGHYNHHFDWSANAGGWGRVSSIMAWVDDGSMAGSGKGEGQGQGEAERLVGGGTEFPLLPRRPDMDAGHPAWCRFVECGHGNGTARGSAEGGAEEKDRELRSEDPPRGITFKVVPGNAVYWENFAPDGRGYDETWHAGLPVDKGTKVGLNIWSFGRIE